MEYVEVDAKKTDSEELESGITDKEKSEFFKLYTKLSPRIKRFVGRKKDGKLIKSAFSSILKGMRELNSIK